MIRVKEVEDYFLGDTSLTYCSNQVVMKYLSRVSEDEKLRSGSLNKSRVVYSKTHPSRVGYLCKSFVNESLNGGKAFQDFMYVSGLLHDIGKNGVSEKVLSKKGCLKEDEWVEVKKHPELGHSLLLKSSLYSKYAQVVLQHHERVDGSGYPYGLRGDDICISAKILGIVDSFDAMVSTRVYSDAKSVDLALTELSKCVDYKYDRELCEKFVNFISERISERTVG